MVDCLPVMRNLDALIKESVCSESTPSVLSTGVKDYKGPDVQNGGKQILKGPKGILNSSINFVKYSQSSSNPYDDLESNPKIIKISKNSEMFRTFSFFHKDPPNGLSKSCVNGWNDDIPVPKFLLYSGKVLNKWRDTCLQAGGGLHNQGNTCFLNSVLQCLAYTAPLYNALNGDDHSSKCRVQSQTCMLCEIQRNTKRIFDHPQSAISPMTIVNKIREIGKCFHYGRQEDAHEFLIHLFDSMQKACLFNRAKLDNFTQSTSLLYQIFGGFCRSQVICSRCQNKSNTYDPFLTLSIDVQHCQNITDSLFRYTKKEHLGNDNMYKCEKCRQKVEATRRVTFQRLPKIFIFHLKRFNYNGLNMKLSKHLAFPEYLEMKNFLSESSCKTNPSQYRLYAVLVHSGFSSHSGHYYCFVKSPSGIWYKCNDSNVSKCSLNIALQSEAYLLFYNQVPTDLSATPSPTSKGVNHLPSEAKHNLPTSMMAAPAPMMNGNAHPSVIRNKITFGSHIANGPHRSNNIGGETAGKHLIYNQNRSFARPSPLSSDTSLSADNAKEQLSFKIPKRTEKDENTDATNKEMFNKAENDLLESCSSAGELKPVAPNTEKSISAGSMTNGGTYDRLHPYAKTKRGIDAPSVCEASKSMSMNKSKTATELVSYPLGDESDESDDDQDKCHNTISSGPPVAKAPKLDVGDETNDSASTISSNISLFTSSGSNSNAASLNNICPADTSTNHAEASKPSSEKRGKLSVEPIANNISKCTNSSNEWDVKPQNAVPSSPSYSNTSVCSTDKNWSVHDSNSKHGADDWSENEGSLESTLTIGTNHEAPKLQGRQSGSGKVIQKNSDIVCNHNSQVDQRNERSPSVSSTESSSSLTKKVPPLKSLKDHVIKLVRGNASKKNNSVHTISRQSCSPTEENPSSLNGGLSNFVGKQESTSRSPHEDHNYVQPTPITTESKEVNSNRNSFPISSGCTKLLKDSLNNAGISFTATPNTKKMPADVAPPVTVPRSNNFAHRDVLEHLANQNVTKSWNGIVNNNNINNKNSWHLNSKPYGSKLVHREYDEFDAEIDRGRMKRRKSFDNRNYRGANNRNQFQEFYEGNKHNNFQPYRSNSYGGGGHGRRYPHYH